MVGKDRIKMEELHQQRVNQMIKSAEGRAGLFARNHEAHSMERRSTDPEEEDARLLEERTGQTLAVWRKRSLRISFGYMRS